MKITLSFLLFSLFLSISLITSNGFSFESNGRNSPLLKRIVNRIMPTETDANTTCGVFANYNFSSMNATEWSGLDQDKEFIYYLRLCGVVENPLCQADPLTKHSMLCQVQVNNSKMVYNIAAANPLAMNWTYISPSNTSAGVRLTMHNGDMCGSMNRTMIGLFTCGTTTGNFTVVTSAVFGDCTYTLHVPTPLACVSEEDKLSILPAIIDAPITPHRVKRNIPKLARNKFARHP